VYAISGQSFLSWMEAVPIFAKSGPNAAVCPRAVRAERSLEDLVDRVDEDETDGLARLRRQLLEVVLILARQNDPTEAGTLGGEHLLANAADRQHLAGLAPRHGAEVPCAARWQASPRSSPWPRLCSPACSTCGTAPSWPYRG
jgi:hypothetical protein